MSLAKSISIGLLSLMLLVNALVLPAIYLDFEIRKEFIQKVLCINKKKPITVCGGHCFITKEFQNALDHSGTEELNSVVQFDLVYPIPSASNLLENLQKEGFIVEHFIAAKSGEESNFTSSSFKPPKA